MNTWAVLVSDRAGTLSFDPKQRGMHVNLVVLYANDRYQLEDGSINPLEEWDGQPGTISFTTTTGGHVTLAVGGIPVTVLARRVAQDARLQIGL